MSIQKKSEKVTDKPEGKKNIKKSGEEKKGKEITAKKNSEKKEMENGTAVTSKKETVTKDSVKIKKEKKTTAEKITKNDTAENEKKDDEEFEPWILIRNAKLTLFRSLNCIKEMYIQMLPILKKEDEERLNKLQQLSKDKEPLSYEKLNELLTIMDRLSLGEEIYRQSIIISLITKFDEFYSTILYVCLKENPKWINTAQKTLTYNDVLNIKSIEDFKKQIIDEEVESLMRDSHWKQIKYLDEKLKLGIFDDYNDIDKFLELTERRNLYVHTSGIVSNIYLSNLKNGIFQ